MPSRRKRTSGESSLSGDASFDPSPSPSPAKRAKPSRRGRGKTERSIWNSTDDWDTLVAESGLSTSSISTRQPRPRGLQTLVECSAAAAGRGFKRLWEEEVKINGEVIVAAGREWKASWTYIPDHLKEKVRDAVFRWWGSYLTLDIINQTFAVPPTLSLPGGNLPSIAQAQSFKIFDTCPDRSAFTSLILTNATQASDTAIARPIYFMPNLEIINLKGCSLAGSTTVKTILDQCPNLRKINLKGTKVNEGDIKLLLRKYGKQLETFKIDNVDLETVHPSSNAPTRESPARKSTATRKDTSETFDSQPFDRITHLCLPGDVINGSSAKNSLRKTWAHTMLDYPTPRAPPQDTQFDWCRFSTNFPALTHLYLPGLLIPPGTIIDLPSSTLVKLSLGAGGPPVPITTLVHLLETQCQSLKSLDLGHILPVEASQNLPRAAEFLQLGTALAKCTKLETFRLRMGPQKITTGLYEQGMKRYSDLIYGPALSRVWRHSLKRLSLTVPQDIDAVLFLHPYDTTAISSVPLLEELDLPSANIDNTAIFAQAMAGFPNLRSLDLSGTTIQEDDMRVILEGCPLLSRVDLTSCRGINVRHRRNIFKAFE